MAVILKRDENVCRSLPEILWKSLELQKHDRTSTRPLSPPHPELSKPPTKGEYEVVSDTRSSFYSNDKLPILAIVPERAGYVHGNDALGSATRTDRRHV